jgi:hypothetical protein
VRSGTTWAQVPRSPSLSTTVTRWHGNSSLAAFRASALSAAKTGITVMPSGRSAITSNKRLMVGCCGAVPASLSRGLQQAGHNGITPLLQRREVTHYAYPCTPPAICFSRVELRTYIGINSGGHLVYVYVEDCPTLTQHTCDNNIKWFDFAY